MRLHKGMDALMKVGIFSGSLLVAFVAAYFYSPVIKSNASNKASAPRVRVSIGEVISLSLDTTALSLSASSPSSTGVFTHGQFTATVETNSMSGYELYFSSEDSSTDMIHVDSTVSDVISSDFSGTVTSDTMDANKWGYSLDGTNFLKIPTLSSQAIVKNIDHAPTDSEKITPVYIGAKISSSLTSGSYKKRVYFSAVAHVTPETRTITDITEMQQMTSAICYNTAVNVRKTLIDTRDDSEYSVRKAPDGRCYMGDNLKLTNKQITSEDSDVSADFTVPASSSGFSTQDTSNMYLYSGNNTGYYTFYAATAGTGGTDLSSGDAPSSICPKGWRLPTNGELQTLYSFYDNVSFDRLDANLFVGYILRGRMYELNNHGMFWASTTYNSEYAKTVYLDSDEEKILADNRTAKYAGAAIRCVAK